jgi:regulator of RNase E activity RraA
MGAHGYCHFPSLHQTVRVCGLTVRPGDLLHGDSNGLTTIPAQVAPLVAEGCARYLTAEAEILNYLKESQVDRPGFAKARAECVRQLAAIEKWLKSKILGG